MIEADHIISKSILAGIAIGIGGFIFLSCHNQYIGALLFSVGLGFVINFKLNLYTGKSGFLSNAQDLQRLLLVLILNLIGSFLFGLIAHYLNPYISLIADKLVMNRIDTPITDYILKSIITGFLMTLAVDSEKNKGGVILTLLSVMAFILSGCYHCIADTFYYGLSSLTFNNIGSVSLRLLITIVFNFIGCCMYNLFINKSLMSNEYK